MEYNATTGRDRRCIRSTRRNGAALGDPQLSDLDLEGYQNICKITGHRKTIPIKFFKYLYM